MATSVSNLVDNLREEIYKTKCKDCDCFLQCESVNENSIKYKYLSRNKSYSSKIDEELKKRFKSTFKYSNNDINKFILLLRKCDREKVNEISLPEKEEFYSNLNMEDIPDADYMHPKRFCEYFKIKNLGAYPDFYLKNYTLVLDNVFESFRKMYLKIYHLDPAKFLSAS